MRIHKNIIALELLGNGFLQHYRNNKLRESLSKGELTEREFYRQLLLLIYRLLFLMVAEPSNLLLAGDGSEKARIYDEYYSINRLRILAERKSYSREGSQDIWLGVKATFSLFAESGQGGLLNLSPLNGDLFGSNSFYILDNYAIDNHDLLSAIRELSLYEYQGRLRKVNYAALDVEELGSVYESLLDSMPRVSRYQGIYNFKLVAGSERKTTGSYYTPPELVRQIIKSTLEPVITDKMLGKASVEEKKQALLSITVCDPACGSGHFLLAAARRIGKELAQIITGESHPSAEALNHAIRDVIQNCIYGVDLNPLAVDLCKVALWIEGFCRGLPLNFLDHRIKCGNSLVGVMDISVLSEGIPDNAFKAVTGDSKKLSKSFKDRNKQEIKVIKTNQLSLFTETEGELDKYVENWLELGQISEVTTEDINRKKEEYLINRSEENKGWWRDYSACNLWTAAFFMALTEENLELIPTTQVLSQLLEGNLTTIKVVKAANSLAQEKRFFHWYLEFPEIFADGGFSCVLGNPPWERIKLQEKEFFASRDEAIAKAKNKAARDKLIKGLAVDNPQLLGEFEKAKHDVGTLGKFIRESGRFLLTGKGDINTYTVFTETVRNLINGEGRVGVIVPTGIATDATCQNFFGDLIAKQSLASFYDFENREKLFVAVDSRMKFSLLNISGKGIEETNFFFFLTQAKQLEDKARVFKLSPQDIALMNPNTNTCPIFRSIADAELTKKIYQRVPVLENEKTGENPWGISFMAMFHMSNDSGLFVGDGGDVLPLYEAKMFHQFDHRWGSYHGDKCHDVSLESKGDLAFSVKPRYWVNKAKVESRLTGKWDRDWLIGFRHICRATNEHTSIFGIMPKVGFSDSVLLMLPDKNNSQLISCLCSNLNSLIFDFVTRQKIGGTSLSFFIVKQLPIIPPNWYTQAEIEFISSRVLELVYTAWDMKPFAEDMGYSGEPFMWDEARRAILKAELDAKFAQLYGLTRDELRYILDPADVYGPDFPSETFRVLKNKEIKKYGEYRTQRLILAAWDMLTK